MRFHKIICFICCVLLLSSNYICFAASTPSFTTAGFDALSFTSSGPAYIYSNNPEWIKDDNMGVGGKYTILQKLRPNKQFVAEYIM